MGAKPPSKAPSSTAVVTRSRSKPPSISKPQPGNTRSRKRKTSEDEELAEEEEEEKDAPANTPKDSNDAKPAQKDTQAPPDDELAEIGGVKPKMYMRDGEEREFKSMTRYVHPQSTLAIAFSFDLQLLGVQDQTYLGSLLLHLSGMA
jgi:DNA ligase-1